MAVLGYTWLIWLAHPCLPAAAVSRLALQPPTRCLLPVVVPFCGVSFFGKDLVASGCAERGGSELPKEAMVPHLVFPASC